MATAHFNTSTTTTTNNNNGDNYDNDDRNNNHHHNTNNTNHNNYTTGAISDVCGQALWGIVTFTDWGAQATQSSSPLA